MTATTAMLALLLTTGAFLGALPSTHAHACAGDFNCDGTSCPQGSHHLHADADKNVCFGLLSPLDDGDGTGVASEPVGACDGGLGVVEIGWGAPGYTFYVDDRGFVGGNGLWLYQESNGLFTGGDPRLDLQRGGASALLGDDEVCWDGHAPDLLLF